MVRAGPLVCWKPTPSSLAMMVGEGGFAEAGRSEEHDVIERFAACLGGLERDGELLFGLGLADELGKAMRAELQFKGVVLVDVRGGDEAVSVGTWCERWPGFIEGCIHIGDGRPKDGSAPKPLRAYA